MGHTPQDQDMGEAGHFMHDPDEKRAALADFGGGWFVLWRDAAHRIGDEAINQLQAILGMGLISPFGKTKFDQAFIE